MKNKLISILLIVCMMISFMPVTVKAATGGTGTPSEVGITGNGVQSDPFIITNADQLAYVALKVNANETIGETGVSASTACYKLGNDIDLSCYPNWMPIGVGTSFFGSFDGDGKRISNLTINTDTLDRVGLFARSYGTIQNIGVTDVNIRSTYSGYQNYIGGLVGHNRGTIQNSYSTGKVLNVDTTAEVGGLVGRNTGQTENPSTVKNSYSLCEVVGGKCAGGLLGTNDGVYTTVQNCYATGAVESIDFTGGFLGINQYGGNVINGYWLSTSVQKVNGSIQVAKGIGTHIFSSFHTNVISFDSGTLASEVYGTTSLLSALNAWVLSQGSDDTPSQLYSWTLGSATPEFGSHIINYALINLSASGEPTSVMNGSTLSATLAADSGNMLPESITVKMGGKTLTVETDYTYNSTTGAVTIPNVTSFVVITASAVVPNYDVTITVHRDDIAWNDHGKSFKLVKSGTDYTDLTSIPNGTYDVYEATTDTGVDVTVNNADASAIVDYYSVTLTPGEGIASTSGGGTYLKGSNPVINAVVNTNYTWSKWTMTTGGAELSTTNNYTITNIQSAISYTATAVKNPPTIGTIPEQSPILTGSDLNVVLTKPVISEGAYTITSQGWLYSADGSTNWNSIPLGSICSAAMNGYYLKYYVIYSDPGSTMIHSPNVVQMTINRYTPSILLSVEPTSPQISGTTISLKASISGGIHATSQGYLNTVPVVFKEGTNTLGTAIISATTGIATFETTTLAVGDHSITAEFPGDDDFNAPTTSSVINYTITAAPVDPDIAVVEAAKSAAQSESYNNMTQMTATSDTVIAEALKATAEAAVNNGAVTITINENSYNAPIAGTLANPSGTNGSYVFTITVAKGLQSQTTIQKTITITATAYTAPTVPSGGSPTTQTNTDTKTITVVEAPQSIPDKKLLTVEPVGEAFDKSVEVRLKEDAITEGMVRKAMEAVFSSKPLESMQLFPLDISIYLKGSDTKVQPKEGTSVIITCPIPTKMLPNKDKLVVVCVIEGELHVLPVTLVMKDNVPCVQFTATHFSPYAFVIDNDNELKDYVTGTLPEEVTYISTKLTTTAGTVTKVELEGIKEGSVITYHVSTPTLISVDRNGNLFAKKASRNAILMAKVTYGGATTVYTIRITVNKAKGGTDVGFIKYYNDIITFNKINYRITAKATDKTEGTVAVANNQINKNLPEKVRIPATITYQGKTYKVTSIDESAFYNVSKITSVTIPYSVEEISSTAFVSCYNLKTFTVSSGNQYYSAKKGMLLNKEGTILIAYPSAKGTIIIDKKIEVIGAYAFSVCRYLTEVVIPKTVTRIDGCAFAHSKHLRKVTFQSTEVLLLPFLSTFEKVSEAVTIFVPETSLLKYQAAFRNSWIPKGTKVNGILVIE